MSIGTVLPKYRKKNQLRSKCPFIGMPPTICEQNQITKYHSYVRPYSQNIQQLCDFKNIMF